MREINGLGALQMGVTGDDHLRVAFAQPDEGALQPGDFAEQRDDFIAQPEAHIKRHLVIARAAGVQFCAGGHAAGEIRLDVHVDVLEFGIPGKLPGGDFASDLFQATGNGPEFGPG